MKNWITVTMTLVPLVAAAFGLASAADDRATTDRRFVDPAARAESWDSAERDEWQKPWTVLRFLGVAPGQKIADLGAGTGYFVRVLSSAVEDAGTVYAVDVEPAMLEHIKNRDDLDPTLDNIVTVLADPDDPNLPAGELDLVLIVNTWHHLDRRVKYLRRLEKSLRPSGRVALIDWRPGDLPFGPPEEHRLSPEQVQREFRKAGWRLDAESVALPYQYLLVFLPPAKD